MNQCELKAIDYLSRYEQCRSGLHKKLIDRGFDEETVNAVLDDLEEKKYLSDDRFAKSWLNTRKINHAEGRARLQTELLSRGLSREVVKNALDDFFSENDETEIARRALDKLTRKGKAGDKLIAAMIRQGFSYKMVMEIR